MKLSLKFYLYWTNNWDRVGTGPAIRLRSGRTGQDRTRPDENFIRPDETGFLPVHPTGQNRIFAGSSGRTKPDFCEFDVKNEPAGFSPHFCRISAGFSSDFCRIFAGFLPDFCQFDVKKEPAGFLPVWGEKWTGRILTRPDRTNFESGRTGPDGKNPSGSNSGSDNNATNVLLYNLNQNLSSVEKNDHLQTSTLSWGKI